MYMYNLGYVFLRLLTIISEPNVYRPGSRFSAALIIMKVIFAREFSSIKTKVTDFRSI